jgi:hypothetical protein
MLLRPACHTTASDTDIATDTPTAGALDTTALVTPGVRALAQSLADDPRVIFERPRNTYEYESYYPGAVKGTQEATIVEVAGILPPA